jgi:hypothetical protein
MTWRVTKTRGKGSRIDVRIRLVVTKGDVEAWLILLDQVGFEDQRVRFARHHDRIHVGELPDEGGRLETVGGVDPQVRANARTQTLRLPDIQ